MLSIRELQTQEITRKTSGFRVIENLEAEAAAEAAENADYSKGITAENVIPGESFVTVVRTSYEDPDFVACFSDLMGCDTIREKAVCLGEYLSVCQNNTDVIDRAALEALPKLGLKAAKEFLRELQAVAPNRNWAECMNNVREALAV